MNTPEPVQSLNLEGLSKEDAKAVAIQIAILRDIARRACFGDAKAAEVLSPYLGLLGRKDE